MCVCEREGDRGRRQSDICSECVVECLIDCTCVWVCTGKREIGKERERERERERKERTKQINTDLSCLQLNRNFSQLRISELLTEHENS